MTKSIERIHHIHNLQKQLHSELEIFEAVDGTLHADVTL